MPESQSPAFDLHAHRDRLLRRVLPEYRALGVLAFAHLQGSLVLGYTDRADLDVVLVWDQPEAPTGRDDLVARLDERQREWPEAIDYRDIHLDRFVQAGQDYEVAHYALRRFEQAIDSVRSGTDLPGRAIVDPLALAAGLRHAVFLADPAGRGRRLQDSLLVFPEHLRTGTRRTVLNNRERSLAELWRYAERGDWFAFHCAVVGTGRRVLQALLAARGVYWSGDKWRREALVRAGLPPPALAAYDRLWATDTLPPERIAALQALMSLVQEAGEGGGMAPDAPIRAGDSAPPAEPVGQAGPASPETESSGAVEQQERLRTHAVTLTGYRVVLRPMTEADWPMVERLNNDPRLAFYTEDDDWQPYTLGRLQQIYRGISQNALMFVIEHGGRAVGECWLQRMNVPRILAEFPGKDVRRIDLAIGEPALWGRGLGAEAIRLLVGLAFEREGADALVCFCGGHNPRSRRAFEKAGLRVRRTVPRPGGGKTAFGYDLLLTRQEYAQAGGAGGAPPAEELPSAPEDGTEGAARA
jgi:RimJ/RimL family protein N-acetyltransferase